MIDTDPQAWAYTLDLVFEDTEAHWAWRLDFMKRLDFIRRQRVAIDRELDLVAKPIFYVRTDPSGVAQW